MKIDNFSAPIPGENYTSDTKNYAWHRPPEHTDLDKAVDDIAKKLFAKESSVGLFTMLENGATVADLAQILLMSGVEKGKWTVDFALLLAGPTAHIISLMAKGYNIKYDMGIEDKTVPMTKAFFDGFKVSEPKELSSQNQTEILNTVKSTGFMEGLR